MQIVPKEIAEVKDVCGKLNDNNRQYVLAVANALKFSQDHAQKPRQDPQKKDT